MNVCKNDDFEKKTNFLATGSRDAIPTVSSIVEMTETLQLTVINRHRGPPTKDEIVRNCPSIKSFDVAVSPMTLRGTQ